MATFFSLRDGDFGNSSTYGYSLSAAEVMSNTTGIWLSTIDAYGPTFIGDGSSISAVAVHLSARSADPTSSVLTLKLSSASSIRTETYPVSSFTSYNGSYNLLTNHPQNWQILKLSSIYTLPRLSACKISLATSSISSLALICGASNNYNKAIISSSVSAISSTLLSIDGGITSSMVYANSVLISKSGTVSGSTDSPFTDTTGISASYYSNSGNIFIPNASNTINLNSSSWTWDFFVKPLTSTVDMTLFQSGDFTSGTYYWSVFIRPNGEIHFYHALWGSGSTERYIYSSANFNFNQWNHVVFCLNNGTFNCYVNGIKMSYADVPVGSFPFYNNIFTAQNGNVVNITLATFKGYITGIRFINGYCLYTGQNITVPTKRIMPYINTQAYIIEANSGKYYYNSNVTDTMNLHLGSSLLSSGIEPRNITVNSDILVDNLFVHNNANVSFNTSSSPILMVKGVSGIQITSDGTLNVGTSSSQVPLSSTHTILLSNTQIDVHNGGNLNIYGYPKKFTTNLISDINSGVRTFSAVDAISNIWNIGDTLIFKPNLTNRNGFDTLTLSSFLASNIFTTTANSTYSHTGSATYSYIPAIYNLNRNVIIKGYDSGNRGSIRTIDAAKININYTQFTNSGFTSANKIGLVLSNNSSGSSIISACSFDIGSTARISLSTQLSKPLQNVTISNNIFNNPNTTTLSSLSVVNFDFSSNYILNPQSIGLTLAYLSGTGISMSNNTIIGSLNYGTFIYNCNLVGSYGANSFNSNTIGMVVSGTNYGTIVGGGLNSVNEGVYVDASTYNLSGITFQSILANNNGTVGFKVSGNNSNYLTPVILNINGLLANTNSSLGFEGYNITGNLSSITSSSNTTGGIRTSIGNGSTVFDGLTSISNNISLNILSGYNYDRTVVKNAYLSANVAALALDSTRFTEFGLDNAILSAPTTLQLNITRNLFEGSYLINNSYLGVTPLGSGITTKYQPEAYRNCGFSFTNLNKISGYNIAYFVNGSRSLDSTIYFDSSASERLTPYSATKKLRSSSKYVALNTGDKTTVKVYVRKSTLSVDGTEYNGNAPRLMVKRNSSIGISDDTVAYEFTDYSTDFQTATIVSPVATNNGVVEFYIDCDGTQGWINIDNWTAI